MEVELRSKVENFNSIKNKLQEIGAKRKDEIDQTDKYFSHKSDKERQNILRIRNERSEGSKNVELTWKGESSEEDDTSWPEKTLKIEDTEAMEQILVNCDFESVVEINKHRLSYNLGNFEINLDRLKKLGDFIEVEIMTNNPKRGKEKILSVFDKIGVSENQIVRKGYVQLVKELDLQQK